MFGNKIGWFAAAIMLSLDGLIVYAIIVANQITPPTQGLVSKNSKVALNLATNAELLKEIKIPGDINAILPDMVKSEDSAPLYRQAIAKYNEDPYLYTNVIDPKTLKPKTTELASLPAINLLVEARYMKSMELFSKDPSEVINYRNNTKTIEALYNAGVAAGKLGMWLADVDKEKAIQLAEAQISLGWKLTNERVRFQELRNGMGLLREGLYLLSKLDPAKSSAALDADAKLQKLFNDQFVPLWSVIGAIDMDVVGATGGDVFYVVDHSKETMWRTEAVLKLGQYRHNAGENGSAANTRWANIRVKKIAQSTTESAPVKIAAEQASKLTVEEYRSIGGGGD